MKRLGFLILLFASPRYGGAVGTQIWETRDFKTGAGGATSLPGNCKLENIIVNNDGIASLAPELKFVWKNPDVYIWSILETQDRLYIGTGGEGKIYRSARLQPRNETDFELFFDTKQAGVFSLAEFNSKIYAGTSPNGIIFVINNKGDGKIFKETGENYIWGMEFDNEGNLYTATGTTGKILKITKDGTLDTFYTVSETNVSFFTKYKDYFYAGTGEKGRLFRIDRKGKGECIYDAVEKEIKSVVFSNNLLFIAATGDTAGAVYCISENKKVQKIWGTNSPIRGFQKVNDELLVSAGNRIFRIENKGTPHLSLASGTQYTSSLLAELPTNISCMKNSWFGTSELGNLYKLQKTLASKGTIESKAYDTKGVSEWGRVEFEGTPHLSLASGTGSPENGNIELFTHSGNTEEPDETWNDWVAIASSGKIKSPFARFIQWKAVLTTQNHSLKSVSLAFLPQNNKPEILAIELKEAKKEPSAGSRTLYGCEKILKWNPEDIDNDSLNFNLYFRLVEEKNWTLLKEAIKDTFYNIDPLVFPDGKYEFKVEVSDSLTNSIEYYLKSDKISAPYIIDNTGPSISINVEQGFSLANGGKIKVRAVDNFNYIKSCEYAIDGGNWIQIFPIDRIFDSKEEEFNITVGKAGKIVIRVFDSSGNASLQSKLLK